MCEVGPSAARPTAGHESLPARGRPFPDRGPLLPVPTLESNRRAFSSLWDASPLPFNCSGGVNMLQAGSGCRFPLRSLAFVASSTRFLFLWLVSQIDGSIRAFTLPPPDWFFILLSPFLIIELWNNHECMSLCPMVVSNLVTSRIRLSDIDPREVSAASPAVTVVCGILRPWPALLEPHMPADRFEPLFYHPIAEAWDDMAEGQGLLSWGGSWPERSR
jgi:hypothetical protein